MNTKQSTTKILTVTILTLITLACGTLIQPQLPTLVPTAIRPPEEITQEALALLPTFTPLPDVQPEVAGLTPGNPYQSGDPTEAPALPTRTPTRTATPTITPTFTPSLTPTKTPFPTVDFFLTRTPIPPGGGDNGGGGGGGGGGDNPATNTPPPGSTATPRPTPRPASPRHGVAASLYSQDNTNLSQWRYSWSPFVPVFNNLQHVPMISGSPRETLPSVADIQLADQRTTHDYWLAFNECEHQNQCNSSPQSAADYYHNQVIDLLYNQGGDPNARLIVGGVNAHPCGIKWLTDFVNYYQNTYGPLPHTGWHFHIYPELRPQDPNGCTGSWIFDDTLFPNPQAAFDLWKQHAYNALNFVQTYGNQTDEIWFTEMGCLNYGGHQVEGPICQAEGFILTYAQSIVGWLNGEGRWVTRYAWYTDWTNAYFKVTMLLSEAYPPNHTGALPLTPLGQYYSGVTPASAVSLPWP